MTDSLINYDQHAITVGHQKSSNNIKDINHIKDKLHLSLVSEHDSV